MEQETCRDCAPKGKICTQEWESIRINMDWVSFMKPNTTISQCQRWIQDQLSRPLTAIDEL